MCHFRLLIYRVLNNELEKPVEGTALDLVLIHSPGIYL
jgi:hypothetical protein